MPKSKQEKMAKRAKPIRELLCRLVRTKVTTMADRKRLAKYMGTSVHYVHSMLYRNEGGLDAWINAVMFALDVTANELGKVVSRKLFKKR